MSQTSERYFMGLDIGGTNARAALVALDGAQHRILSERKLRIREDTSPIRIAELVATLCRDCSQQNGLQLGDLAGIGIGVAGQLALDGRCVLNAPNLAWRNVDFAGLVESYCPGSTVRLANDLAAIVWGEAQLGAARGYKHLWAVYVGTGIGSGLVLDGRLYRGGGGKAGEVGHAKLVGASAPCGCGQRGCLEAVAGGKGIERRLAQDLASGAAQSLHPWLADAAAPTASDVERAHEAGLDYAVALWDELSDELCAVLSAGLALLNPQALLLGGGVLQGCARLQTRLLEKLAQRVVEVAWRDLSVLCPQLGDDAGVLGAALLCAD